MKKLNTIIVIVLLSGQLFAQDEKKMSKYFKAFVSENFNRKASITIQSLGGDAGGSLGAFTNALASKGFKTISSTSIANKTDLLVCYPNPAFESVNFSYILPDGTSQGQINIYNSIGQIIKSIPINKTSGIETFNLDNQSNGLYFYTLLVNSTTIARGKFIVNK